MLIVGVLEGAQMIIIPSGSKCLGPQEHGVCDIHTVTRRGDEFTCGNELASVTMGEVQGTSIEIGRR